jgi:hypothetical protein
MDRRMDRRMVQRISMRKFSATGPSVAIAFMATLHAFAVIFHAFAVIFHAFAGTV